ncbi:MAG: hypothetical protein O7B35_17840 [Deltaproteobacteria bacterium]|nr:hypothetical protein [Deltaproteobacteria bacterium]
MSLKSHRLDQQRAGNQRSLRIFAGLVIAAVLYTLLLYSYAAEEQSAQHDAEQWEEIAKIRLEAARGHELQAEIKREEAFKRKSTDSPDRVGDALNGAGDEKYLASGDYQKASKHWKKAAEVHETTGGTIKAKNARGHADTAWEAAKRTLIEGTLLHRMAEEQYANANNLVKRTAALEKVARNLERLMKMK